MHGPWYPITDKRKNYAAWTAGGFGNRLRAWPSITEFEQSETCCTVSMRYLEPGGPCFYDVAREELRATLKKGYIAMGFDPTKVMVNESAPDESVSMQGEFFNDVAQGVTEGFLFSTAKLKMRDALAHDSTWVSGMLGRAFLRSVMTPSSWSDFEVLLEQYPGHIL